MPIIDHYEEFKKEQAEKRAKLRKQFPDEKSVLDMYCQTSLIMAEFGWIDPWKEYPPTDGTEFLCVEFGSTGIHKCNYEGEYPFGGFFINGDSPTTILMWKLK